MSMGLASSRSILSRGFWHSRIRLGGLWSVWTTWKAGEGWYILSIAVRCTKYKRVEFCVYRIENRK